MALIHALALTGALAQQPARCEFIVRGQTETETEFLRLVNLYRAGSAPLSELMARSRPAAPAFAKRVREVREMAARDIGWAEYASNREIAKRAPQSLVPDDLCIQTGSLLETEIAMSFAARSRWDDGDAHFDSAWRISHLIEDPARRSSFERDWLLATGLFHQQLMFANPVEEAFVRADRYFDNAVRNYPSDPEVLLAAASLLEWSGTLGAGDRALLKEADDLYSRAQQLTPSDPEVLLRHGRVLEKLGRKEEAATLLFAVLELVAREDLTYRARMALGRMAERSMRLAEAIEHYEAAASAIPSWQVAHVALGHALHASGAHDRSRERLGNALVLSLESADEAFGGWWGYELGISLRFQPLLERMRAEVRR